jgi:hypothetical protein
MGMGHSLIVGGLSIDAENLVVTGLYRCVVLSRRGVAGGGLLRAHGDRSVLSNIQKAAEKCCRP